ncbi:MAG TPA: hypothetical protein PKO15_12835 [Fibrobacteria bacterium]|nr:hypothetical protein [Fibrobacteria bacterium]
MDRLRLAILIAACAVWALAVFVRVEAGSLARRAWHRIACAWMQCDEAPG